MYNVSFNRIYEVKLIKYPAFVLYIHISYRFVGYLDLYTQYTHCTYTSYTIPIYIYI